MVVTGRNWQEELGLGRKRNVLGERWAGVRMGSASAKPTARQALCDSWDLWVEAAVARWRFPIVSRLRTTPMLEPDTCDPFPDTTFVDEIPLQAPDLLVEEIVGLMDETNGDICNDLRRTSVAELAEIAVIRIRPRRNRRTNRASRLSFSQSRYSRSKEIVIVVEQFL
jgi:hypothetical protein